MRFLTQTRFHVRSPDPNTTVRRVLKMYAYTVNVNGADRGTRSAVLSNRRNEHVYSHILYFYLNCAQYFLGKKSQVCARITSDNALRVT